MPPNAFQSAKVFPKKLLLCFGRRGNWDRVQSCSPRSHSELVTDSPGRARSQPISKAFFPEWQEVDVRVTRHSKAHTRETLPGAPCGWQTATRSGVWGFSSTSWSWMASAVNLASPSHVFSPQPSPSPFQLLLLFAVAFNQVPRTRSQFLQACFCLTLEVQSRFQHPANHSLIRQIFMLFSSTWVELDTPEAELLCLVISHPHLKTIKTRVAWQPLERSYLAGQWRKYCFYFGWSNTLK